MQLTYITAAAFAATTLAAPMPESCTGSSVSARGFGLVCTSTTSASKREPEPESCSESSKRGFGLVCTSSSAAAKRDTEEPILEKRTGMGIISSGTDEA